MAGSCYGFDNRRESIWRLYRFYKASRGNNLPWQGCFCQLCCAWIAKYSDIYWFSCTTLRRKLLGFNNHISWHNGTVVYNRRPSRSIDICNCSMHRWFHSILRKFFLQLQSKILYLKRPFFGKVFFYARIVFIIQCACAYDRAYSHWKTEDIHEYTNV